MQINQHNYEDFFLMYADNELTPQQREMVEAFVRQYPALKGELELLQRTVLSVDEKTDFPGKNKLMKKAVVAEEEMLLYLDGEADAGLVKKVKAGLEGNRDLQEAMALWEKTIVKPDENIVYLGKQALYRAAQVKKMDWWKIAAAASVLFLLSTWLFLYNNDDKEPETVAAIDTIMQHSPAETDPVALLPADAGNEHAAAEEAGKDTEPVQEQKKVALANITVTEPGTKNNAATEPEVRVVAANDQTRPTNSAPAEAMNQAVTNAAPQTLAQEAKPYNYEPETVSATPAPQTALAAPEVKEEKTSFLKKIGRRIGDRALDILTDGGEEINVAGFAINVRK